MGPSAGVERRSCQETQPGVSVRPPPSGPSAQTPLSVAALVRQVTLSAPVPVGRTTTAIFSDGCHGSGRAERPACRQIASPASSQLPTGSSRIVAAMAGRAGAPEGEARGVRVQLAALGARSQATLARPASTIAGHRAGQRRESQREAEAPCSNAARCALRPPEPRYGGRRPSNATFCKNTRAMKWKQMEESREEWEDRLK